MLCARSLGELQSLQRVIVAGESCPPQLVALHYERLPRSLALQRVRADRGLPCGQRFMPARRRRHARHDRADRTTIPNARLTSSTTSSPLPVGIAGELLLGGEGLAQGYSRARRPDARSASSSATCLSLGPSRLYRTGDLARWRSDRAPGVSRSQGRPDQAARLPDRARRNRVGARAASAASSAPW